MDLYAIYLRKSRMDLEAEAHGQGETLKRHETALLTLAKQRQYYIGEIYREVVSGDTIAGRPEMQRLLSDVEMGRWKGVLVMEESRLARGDTMDQGRVQQAFYYSHTLIITPNKVFNPDSESDQEYFEFGLFMSRREYKLINRRLQRGRLASVKEGKWVGGQVPFGYRKVDIEHEKGKMLVPIPEQAEVVKAIFEWYVNDDVPLYTISVRLNESGIKTAKGQLWVTESVRNVLDNPVYCGMIRYGSRKVDKIPVNGKLVAYHHRADDVEGENLFRGRHEPIISRELYEAAKKKRSLRKGPPGPNKKPLMNPFAGLCYCSRCGRAMLRNKGKPGSNDRIGCMYPDCLSSVGMTTIPALESIVLDSLRKRLTELEIPDVTHEQTNNEETLLQTGLEQTQRELATIISQKSRAFDLVEQGVYTPDVFTARMEDLTRREEALSNQQKDLESRLEELCHITQSERELAPKIRRVIELYPTMSDAAEKNNLLKTVVSSITYSRPQHSTIDELSLKIFYLV